MRGELTEGTVSCGFSEDKEAVVAAPERGSKYYKPTPGRPTTTHTREPNTLHLTKEILRDTEARSVAKKYK